MIPASSLSHTLIVATGPDGFPGASQILCQALRALSRAGCRVIYVGTKEPFHFRVMGTDGVEIQTLDRVSSAAIGTDGAVQSEDVLLANCLSERIIGLVLRNVRDVSTVWIWGAYLFPYGCSALTAAQVLSLCGIAVHLWITPTGSDIWEIGPQIPAMTRYVLENAAVSSVLTYSERFAVEVADRYSLKREMIAIHPIVDAERFRPATSAEKDKVRKALTIQREAFVISSHSNMRPIKRPEDVILIAHNVAQHIRQREVILLMVGPQERVTSLSLPEGPARVIWTGLVEHVEYILRASDAELNCSAHDSFNLSLAEAMACGLPCVSTDVVGIAPEIVAAEGGFLFPCEPRPISGQAPKGRYEAAVRYLIKLADSEALRAQIGNNASSHARRVFAREKIVAKYLALMSAQAFKGEAS